jgi:SAM-dependent methyltransferase
VTTRSQDIAALVTDVAKTEHEYLLHGDRHDPNTTPWMPYQPADFIAILWDCLPAMEGNAFLDVGCGPGTKMKIARDLFGLEVRGVEIDAAMATEARKTFPDGGHVRTGNALHYTGQLYSSFDLIWLYRPFRDATLERRLEKHIIATMQPGAILAGGSWETDPGSLGWETIVDDTLNNPHGPGCIWRGAWRKPATS